MTDREYFQKMQELSIENLKRAGLPKEELNVQDGIDLMQKSHDLMIQRYIEKQEEKRLEKEFEEKAKDCVEQALQDLFQGFSGSIDIKL